MFSRMFDDIQTENPEQDRKMIMTLLGIATALLFIVPIIGLASPSDRIYIYVMGIISAVMLALAYRGQTMPGRIVVPIIINLGLSYFLYQGGLRDIAMFAIPPVIILSSLLLGRTGSVGSGIFITLAVIFTGISERNGSNQTALREFVTQLDIIFISIMILGTAAIQTVLLTQMGRTARTARQIARAETAANQELRALQLELEQRVAERTAQLRASNEVGVVANSIRDPQVLISKVVKLITNEFKYYYAAIFTVEENGRWANLVDATGSAGNILKSRRHRLPLNGNSMVGGAITSKEPRIALDVGESAVRFNNPLLPNTRSEIALPLAVGERVIGALDVQSTREADFKPEDISTLQSMANQVAIALENARLFEQMNESLEELSQANREYVTSAWEDKVKSASLEYIAREQVEDPSAEMRLIDVPLNLRDQPLGRISLETGNDWSQEDQAWVEALATQLAVSVENARLFEESQQSALRERMSASIIQKIWSAGSIDSILQTAVRELGRALEASEVSIEMSTEEKQ